MKPPDNYRKWIITKWKQAQNIQSCPTDMLEGSPRQNQFSFAWTAGVYESGMRAVVGDRIAGCPCPAFGCTAPEKGKLFIWSRLQITKIAPVRHLKAFTFEPPSGLKYLCWKAADHILGSSYFPLSREWRGLAHAHQCGVTELLSLALSPCPMHSHSSCMANMHCGFLPCFPTNKIHSAFSGKQQEISSFL